MENNLLDDSYMLSFSSQLLSIQNEVSDIWLSNASDLALAKDMLFFSSLFFDVLILSNFGFFGTVLPLPGI